MRRRKPNPENCWQPEIRKVPKSTAVVTWLEGPLGGKDIYGIDSSDTTIGKLCEAVFQNEPKNIAPFQLWRWLPTQASPCQCAFNVGESRFVVPKLLQ